MHHKIANEKIRQDRGTSKHIMIGISKCIENSSDEMDSVSSRQHKMGQKFVVIPSCARMSSLEIASRCDQKTAESAVIDSSLFLALAIPVRILSCSTQSAIYRRPLRPW